MVEEEILGYKLKRVNLKNRYSEHVHFVLTGKRGTKFDLCESVKSVYFVQNPNGDIVGLKGNYTFSTSREHLKEIGAGCFIPGANE